MALHGDIRINGDLLGVWTARRLENPPKAVNDYECEILMTDGKGGKFEVRHKFAEGAIVLAAKVLNRAWWALEESDRGTQ